MKNTESIKEKYKERLKKIIGTKIQTTMIFPLSQFEMAFGHIWGHGKDEANLNDEEKINRQKWNECRNNILNMGNSQKRNCFAELEDHEIIHKGYKTILLPLNQYNEMKGNN